MSANTLVSALRPIKALSPGLAPNVIRKFGCGVALAVMMVQESLEHSLARQISQTTVPGLAVAVVKAGITRWVKAFGLADIAAQTPATPETAYMWFSMTKIVTATAIMQLCDRGQLHLDDPVSRYIRNFPKAANSKPVTIRHLLSHSSGLGNPIPVKWVHLANTAGPDQSEFLNDLLAKHGRLKSNPGEKASYSNIGYVALGVIITAVSGEPYGDYIIENILKPLDMEHRRRKATSISRFCYRDATNGG
jgi:CubicO group peptidase (beta-lactamase class C family)